MELATLSVKVDATQATRETEKLGAALQATGKKADLFTDAQGRLRQANGKYASEAQKAAHATTQLGDAQAKAAKSATELGTAGVAAGKALTYLGGALTVAGVIRGGAALAHMADTAKLMGARLALVVPEARALARTQDALFESAQRSRTSYEALSSLYVRVARNAGALGKTQSELLRFTELVAMELTVSGASASEAAAGVQQLSQALAKGRLDGDEFRSIMENLPTVADALARSLGVTKGELYALSEQGKLTGASLVDAMLNMEARTREAFSKMPPTIAGAWTTAKNQILRDIAEIDARTNASSVVAAIIARLPRAAASAANVMTGNLGSAILAPFGNRGDPGHDVTFTQTGGVERRALEARFAADRAADAARQAERERKTAWEESRRMAAERARWENEAIARAANLAAARLMAEQPLVAGPGTTMVPGGTFGGGVLRIVPPKTVADSNKFLTDKDSALGGKLTALDFARQMQERNKEIAAHFRENMQRSVGDFFSEFLSTGTLSIRSLFNIAQGLGGNLLGNLASTQFGNVTRDLTTKQSIGLGAGLFGVGALVESFFAAGDAARRLAANMKASAVSIQDFAARATRGAETPQQAELRRLQEERTALARQAINAANSGNVRLNGLTGSNLAADIARLVALLAQPDIGPSDNNIRSTARNLLEQLRALQSATAANIAAAQRASFGATADSLKAFGGGLSLSQFSPLSPTAQLSEARSQYDALLQRALGGDQAAAEQFQGSAQQLLGLSRSVNASGGRFTADFNTVRSDTARLEALFRDRASTAEQTASATAQTAENTAATNTILGSGFTTMFEKLDEVTAALEDVVRLQREANAT